MSGWSPREAKTEPITLLLSHGFSRQQYVKAGGTQDLSMLDGGVIYFFLRLFASEEVTVHNSWVDRPRMNRWYTSNIATNKETSKISQWVLRLYAHTSSLHQNIGRPAVFSFLTPGRANYRLPTAGGSNGKRSGDNLMNHFKRRSYFLLFMLFISHKYLFSQNEFFFFKCQSVAMISRFWKKNQCQYL